MYVSWVTIYRSAVYMGGSVMIFLELAKGAEPVNMSIVTSGLVEISNDDDIL